MRKYHDVVGSTRAVLRVELHRDISCENIHGVAETFTAHQKSMCSPDLPALLDLGRGD